MNTRWFMLVMALLIGLAVVAGCAAPTEQLSPTPIIEPTTNTDESPNAAIVLDMTARLTSGDVEGSLAYFAEDAVGYILGLPPTGVEVYRGKEQLRALWEDSVTNHFAWEIEVTDVEGNQVYVQAKTWHDFTRDLGVAPLEYIDVYEIEDGKITTYGSTIVEDALARFKPAFAEVVPAAPPPTPSAETPATEVEITISDGTCSYNGPMTLQAGELSVVAEINDHNQERYAVSFFTLDADRDMLDLMASTSRAGSPPWSKTVFLKELGPDEVFSRSFTVKEGLLYLVCWSGPPDLAIGNAGPFTVVP